MYCISWYSDVVCVCSGSLLVLHQQELGLVQVHSVRSVTVVCFSPMVVGGEVMEFMSCLSGWMVVSLYVIIKYASLAV